MMEPTTPRGHKDGGDLSGQLFETLKNKHGFTTDRQLAAHFGLHRSSVSRVRKGSGPVSVQMKLAIIGKDKMTPEQIEKLIRTPRFKVQPVATQEGAQ